MDASCKRLTFLLPCIIYIHADSFLVSYVIDINFYELFTGYFALVHFDSYN